MLVRSRKGYNSSGECVILNNDTIFDIEDNGKIVGEITGRKLKAYLGACKRGGRKPKYTNVRGNSIICDPDYRAVKPVAVVIIDGAGSVSSSDSKVAVASACSSNSYAIRFDNGLVLGVFNFAVARMSNEFSTVSFMLFSTRETFSFNADFRLAVVITEVTVKSVSGYVEVVSSFRDSHGNKPVRLGDFIIAKTGSVYKDENLGVVYDEVRFTKELVGNG